MMGLEWPLSANESRRLSEMMKVVRLLELMSRDTYNELPLEARAREYYDQYEMFADFYPSEEEEDDW